MLADGLTGERLVVAGVRNRRRIEHHGDDGLAGIGETASIGDNELDGVRTGDRCEADLAGIKRAAGYCRGRNVAVRIRGAESGDTDLCERTSEDRSIAVAIGYRRAIDADIDDGSVKVGCAASIGGLNNKGI